MLLLKPLISKIIDLSTQKERLYYWSGLSMQGECKSGYINAVNLQDARKKLQAQSYIIKKLSTLRANKRLHAADMNQWLQQLAKLLHTGLSLPKALQILSSFQTHPKIIILMYAIQKDLATGMSFSESLAQHPRWFDPLLCAFFNLGEHSGTISTIIEQVAEQRTKNEQLKQQYYTLMLYPALITSMAMILSFYMVVTIIPQLQTFFQHAHAPIPWSIKLLLSMIHGVKKYGLFAFSLVLISFLYIKIAYPYFLFLQKLLDKGLLHIPLLKNLLRAQYLTKSLQAMAISQRAGLPLPDALQWVAIMTGNYYYKRAFFQIRNALQHGESLRSALLYTQMFPELVIQLISLGEESGTLAKVLHDLAHYYTLWLEERLQRLSRYIEPILMGILGILIGSLMLCIYLPMIQLGAVL